MAISVNELKETIATIVNVKALEVFRSKTHEFAYAMDSHLVDLGTRIVDAIDDLNKAPDPDGYEYWLAEMKKAEQQSREPIGSGDPDINTKESNESPATEQSSVVPEKAAAPEKVRVDKKPEPTISGEGSGTTTKKKKPKLAKKKAASASLLRPNVSRSSDEDHQLRYPGDKFYEFLPQMEKKDVTWGGARKAGKVIDQAFFDLLKAWIKSENLSQSSAGKLAGVSDVTICNMVSGNVLHPTKATKKKILRAIKKTKKTANPKPPKKPEPAPQTIKPNGPLDAASFIKLKLTAWMNAEHIGVFKAAHRLSIKECALRSIQKGEMPHANIVHQLAKHIPSIQSARHTLVAAAEQQAAD